jgi:hypothetical protein
MRLSTHLVSLFSLLLVGSTVLACGSDDGRAQGSTEALSTEEAQSLTFTREEEKLARDVYAALESKDPVFSNIKSSEQTHMDAILTLLTRYSLPDPAANKGNGQFTDATLQKLHDELVQQGAPSALAALQVGVAIEELDIRDIEAARKSVTHTDILTTYDNLTRGSRNHLRSFYGKVKSLGGTYTPRYLDAAQFQQIVDSPVETGGPGR